MLDPAESLSALSAGVADPVEEALMRRRMNLELFGEADEVKVGPYEIIRKLGGGTQASVYLGSAGGENVAIKVLRSGHRSQLERERLRREARALSRVEHPAVVRVVDVAAHDEELFLVMEYVGGPDLKTYHDGGPSLIDVMNLYRRLARGVAAVHSEGVLHRDIKPQNVLLRSDATPCLVDFGLARRSPSLKAPGPSSIAEPTLTKTGARLGTPRYMAPEVAEGERASAAADQFSFCVCLWEALFQSPPWRVYDGRVLPGQHQLSKPEVPARTKVPKPLIKLLRRGLSVEPSMRFLGMAELADVLDRREMLAGSRWSLARPRR